MKKRIMAAGLAAAFLLLFAACEFPAQDNTKNNEEHHLPYATIQVYPVPANGQVLLSASRVERKNDVQIYFNPDPGYVLLASSIDKNKIIPETELLPRGNPPGAYYETGVLGNIRIPAQFAHKSTVVGAESNFTVSIDRSLSGGIVYASERVAPAGTPITLTTVPNTGYDIVDGSFEVTDAAGNVFFPPGSITLDTFVLPAADVIVKARFEEKDAEGLLESAHKYMSTSQYDAAASYYREAFKAFKKNNDENTPGGQEALLYSTLADLCGLILKEQSVRDIISVLKLKVPQTLEDLLYDWPDGSTSSRKWFETFKGDPEMGEEDAHLPSIESLNGLGWPTPFQDYPLNQAENTIQKWNNKLFWALLASNKEEGFNTLLNRINRIAFGEKFEALARQSESLPKDAKVPLHKPLYDRFGLKKYYGDDFYGNGGNDEPVYIGYYEINYIFAQLRAYKACFEFLHAYDWTIYFQPFLVNTIMVEDDLNSLLGKVFELNNTTGNALFSENFNKPITRDRILPLRNKFLKMRDAAYLERSRNHLSQALDAASDAMTYWWSSGTQNNSTKFSTDGKNHYAWARAAISAAKNAVDGKGDGIFYFPHRLPLSTEYTAAWPTKTMDSYPHNNRYIRNNVYGVDINQLFMPGKFSIANLVTTELYDKAPSLFKVEWYNRPPQGIIYTGNSQRLTGPIPEQDLPEANVNESGYGNQFSMYSFQIKTDELRLIFPKGYEQTRYFDKTGNRAWLHEVFPEIPLWPRSTKNGTSHTTYFNGNESVARNIWKYYHE